MHIYLEEGSTLRFGEMANVARKFPESNIWVYVHGKEENVDFGPLTPAERALFIFVDAPDYLHPTSLEKIHAYPNPALAGTTLNLLFPRLESEGTKAYMLYSSQGKVMAEGTFSITNNGKVEMGLPAHLAEGVYFLRVTGEQRNYNVNVVVRSIR
ncbi:MAG: T9SS type A sorting domain-containing protein [Lewinella sp.]